MLRATGFDRIMLFSGTVTICMPYCRGSKPFITNLPAKYQWKAYSEELRSPVFEPETMSVLFLPRYTIRQIIKHLKREKRLKYEYSVPKRKQLKISQGVNSNSCNCKIYSRC
jgi:hypothetical protein